MSLPLGLPNLGVLELPIDAPVVDAAVAVLHRAGRDVPHRKGSGTCKKISNNF